MIQECKKIDKEVSLERSVLKTYIVQFIYPNGNGWAFINATSVSQAQSIFYNQTRFQNTKITGIKETKWYGNNMQLVFEGSVTTAQLVNVTISLSDLINNSDNYESIEEYIRSVINLGNYYTKEETDDAITKAIKDMELPEINLSEYVKKEDLSDAVKEEINKLNITSGKDGITPHIDEATNHWFIGDKDTGVVAKGKDGANGINGNTPYIHPASKHWMIGNTDTGVVAEGKSGTSGKSAYEIYCEHAENPLSEQEWIESLGGDVTIQGGNIRRLEDCSYDDGNSHTITYSTIFESNPTFLTHNNSNLFQNPANISTESGVKEYINTFESNNADALSIAKRTREFIQHAIDSTSEDQILLFPKNKVFVIDFSWIAYNDGFTDIPHDYSNDHYMPGIVLPGDNARFSMWYKDKFISLNINKKIHINLNGSTIKLIPNWLNNCTLINVDAGMYHGGWQNVTNLTNPAGTIIENGKIDGNFSNLIKFKDSAFLPYSTREYHVHCIDTARTAHLENLELFNVAGDGATVSSKLSWHSGDPVTFYSKVEGSYVVNNGFIKPDGTISNNSGTNYKGYVYSDFVDIWEYTHMIPFAELMVRPAFANEDESSLVDNIDYWASEYFTVAYYNSSKQHIGTNEILKFGDTLSVPNGTKYLRFSIKRDPSMDIELTSPSLEGSKFMNLWICEVGTAYGTTVKNCTMHHCGRDGLTIAGIPNGEIFNCVMYGCGQLGIDIESTGTLDKNFTIRGVKCASLGNATGHSLYIQDSRILMLRSTNPNIMIENCDMNELILASPTNMSFNHNISLPRRTVKDSIVRENLFSVYSIFENCVIGGDKVHNVCTVDNYDNITEYKPFDANPDATGYNGIRSYTAWWSAYWGNYKNQYNKCTIKTNLLGPSVYNDCIIQPTNACTLIPYAWGTYEQNTFTFNKCKIDVPYIQCVDYSWDDGSHKKFGACVDICDCDIHFTKHAAKATTIYDQEHSTAGSGSNFLGCYIHNLINSRITFSPYDDLVYEFVFYPYQNTKIENNIFIPTNTSPISKLKLIEVDLYNVNANDAFKVSIKDNIIKHNLTTPAQGSKNLNLLSVVQRDFVAGGNIDKVAFNIEGNRYSSNKVVKNISSMDDISLVTNTASYHYYSPVDYVHTYITYPKNNKIEKDIVYYNLSDSKYYKLEETLYPEIITVSGKKLRLPSGQRVQSAQIVEVSNSEVPAQAVVQEHDVPSNNNYATIA